MLRFQLGSRRIDSAPASQAVPTKLLDLPVGFPSLTHLTNNIPAFDAEMRRRGQ